MDITSNVFEKLILSSNKLFMSNDQVCSIVKSDSPHELNKYYSHWKKYIPLDQVIMGFGIDGLCIVFGKKQFSIMSSIITNKPFPNKNFKSITEKSGDKELLSVVEDVPLFGGFMKKLGGQTFKDLDKTLFLQNQKIGQFNSNEGVGLWKNIHHEVSVLLDDYYVKKEEVIKQNKITQQTVLKQKREKELTTSKNEILEKLDGNGDGLVDISPVDDFSTLLKKHQKTIIEIDRTYIQQFVKISQYLKLKHSNTQSLFNKLKEVNDIKVLEKYIFVLESDIHSYNVLLFYSLNMVVSLIDDDMITFYECYELFDKLNIFDSQHEKDVSEKLSNINNNLDSLIVEVRKMSDKIISSLGELVEVTEKMSDRLDEIHSSIKWNNLFSVINTYQNYRVNKKI